MLFSQVNIRIEKIKEKEKEKKKKEDKKMKERKTEQIKIKTEGRTDGQMDGQSEIEQLDKALLPPLIGAADSTKSERFGIMTILRQSRMTLICRQTCRRDCRPS